MSNPIEILEISDSGDASKEYVALKANENVNLSGYALVDKTFNSDGKETDVFRHVYFFPNQAIKKGEYIFLYTKKGTNRPGKTKNGLPAYYFFWGSNGAVWNGKGDSATLISYNVIDRHHA